MSKKLIKLLGEKMSVKTSNAYGNITISNEAIAIVTGYIARDCYGVVDLVNNKLTDSFSGLFKKQTLSKGIKIYIVLPLIMSNYQRHKVVKQSFGTSQ